MTNEERDKAIRILQWLHDNKFLFRSTEEDVKFATKLAIKALEQEPSGDLISRQAVLEQTYNWSKDEFLRVTNPFDYLRKRINSLPSVNPQQKIGHWI